MPTSLIAPIIGGVASAGASSLFGGLFGGDAPKVNNTPPGFNAGGLSATWGGNGYNVAADPSRQAAVGGIANTFGAQAGAIGEQLGRVRPGFGDLRASRLAEIENARMASIGNLRENLGRRRVLGSSFAQDANTRAEAEFAQQRERAQAESFLQEMEMTQQLQQQQFAAIRGQFQTGLDEMNLEANLAAGLSGKATDVLGKNAQVEAMLYAQSQQGAGRFFGQLAQPIGAAAGKSAGDWWNTSGNSPAIYGTSQGIPIQGPGF